MSLLDYGNLAAKTAPQAAGQSDDTRLVLTCAVQAVDPVAYTVSVVLPGGTSVTLPAVAARYSTGSMARVLVDPVSARPVMVLGAVAPLPPHLLMSVDLVSSQRIAVTGAFGQVTIPAPSGTYTAGGTAWVILDEWGIPAIALAPASAPPAPMPPAPPAPPAPSLVAASATIGPQASGTYRAGYGWDAWGASLGGGLATVYQGNGYGSGALTGLGCFGDQIVNLGAVSIDRATLTVRRNASGTGSTPLIVQGAPHGSRPSGAPAPTGSTAATPGASINQIVSVDLPADMREALRTGSAKSLAAVGGTYGGFGGTSTPGSFNLSIQYTRYA